MSSKFNKCIEAIDYNDIEDFKISYENQFMNVHTEDLPSSLLSKACYKGCLEIVKFLLKFNPNLEYKCSNGFQCLHWASDGGHLQIVKLLIDKGAPKEAQTNRGFRPIHCAAVSAQLEIMQYLMSHQVDLTARTIENEHPQGRTVHEIITSNKYFACDEYLKKWNKYDEIFQYLRDDKYTEFKRTFVKEKIFFKEPKNDEMTVIDLAIKLKKRKFINYIMEQEIEEEIMMDAVEVYNKREYPGRERFRHLYRLFRAITTNDIDSVVQVNLNAMNSMWVFSDENFVEIAIRYERSMIFEYLIQRVTHFHDFNKLVKLAEDRHMYKTIDSLRSRENYIINRKLNKISRMHMAVADNNCEMLLFLMTDDKDKLDSRCKPFRDSALSLAITLGYDLCANVLLSAPARIDRTFDDPCGRTPLHLTIINQMNDMTISLINIIADINKPDCLGFTPLHLAALYSSDEIIEMLIDKGADLFAELEIKPGSQTDLTILPLSSGYSRFEYPLSLYRRNHIWNTINFPNSDDNNYRPIQPINYQLVERSPEQQVHMLSRIQNRSKLREFRDSNSGETLLHLCLKWKMIDLLKTFQQPTNGSQPLFDINVVDSHGDSAMSSIIKSNLSFKDKLDNMQFLLQSDADINKENYEHQSPLKYALHLETTEILELMIQNCQQFMLSIEDIEYITGREKNNENYSRLLNDMLEKFHPEKFKECVTQCIELERRDILTLLLNKITPILANYCCESVLFLTVLKQDLDLFQKFVNYEIKDPNCNLGPEQSETLLTYIVKNCEEKFSVELTQNIAGLNLLMLKNANEEYPILLAANRSYIKLMSHIMDELDSGEHSKTLLESLRVLLTKNIKPSKLEKLLKLALKCGADLYQPFDDGFIIMQNLENDQMVKKIKQYMTRSNISMKQSDETECTICFTNKINTSVIPCGHTYCNTCLIQVQNCPHCRGPINGQHPIYISK